MWLKSLKKRKKRKKTFKQTRQLGIYRNCKLFAKSHFIKEVTHHLGYQFVSSEFYTLNFINMGYISAMPDPPSLEHSFPKALSPWLFATLSMWCLAHTLLRSKAYFYAIIWLVTVVCKSDLIARSPCPTPCACVIKDPTEVSNTPESSFNNTPHLGKLGGGAHINKYNEGLLFKKRLESYPRSSSWITSTTKGQRKPLGWSGSEGRI